MKAIDLIIELQKCDPNTEVVFDVTNEGAEMFKLMSVDEVDEIKTPENDKYIMLSCGIEHPEQNNN